MPPGRGQPQPSKPLRERKDRWASSLPQVFDTPLGYRGLRILGDAGNSEIVVSAGIVEIHDQAGRVTRRADPGRGLERWLVEEAAAGAVPPDALGAVRQVTGADSRARELVRLEKRPGG